MRRSLVGASETLITRYDDDTIVSVNLSNQSVADCGCL